MAASAIQDPRAREALLAWAEAQGWAAGWRNGKKLDQADDGDWGQSASVLVFAGWLAGSAVAAGSRGVAKALGPAAVRDRAVGLPQWWAAAGAPILDPAVRTRLARKPVERPGPVDKAWDAIDDTRLGKALARRGAKLRRAWEGDAESKMVASPWFAVNKPSGLGNMVVAAPDRVLAVHDLGRSAWWYAVYHRPNPGPVWCAAMPGEDLHRLGHRPERLEWPFRSDSVWTDRDGDLRWFGPVTAPVRAMVANAGLSASAMASPTAISITAHGPTNGLDPVDGLEQWTGFTGAIVAASESG